MKRPRLSHATAFVAGFASAVLLLVLAHVARPFGFDAADVVDAQAAALHETLFQELLVPPHDIYINSSEDFKLVEMMHAQFPSTQFHRWAERPPDHGCESTDPKLLVAAPCDRPDFVSAQVTDSPLWRVFLVRVGTYNGGCEMALLKSFESWRIVSKRCYVI